MVFLFSQIRRFGKRREQFIFEAGSRCVSGEGIFLFRTEQAWEILEKIEACTKKGLTSKTHCSNSARNPAPQKSDESQSRHYQLLWHSARGEFANDVDYLTLFKEDADTSADRLRSPSGDTSAHLAPTASPAASHRVRAERGAGGNPGEKVKCLPPSPSNPVPSHGSTASLLPAPHTMDVPRGYVDMNQGKRSENGDAHGGSRRQGKPLTLGRRLAEGSDCSDDELDKDGVYMKVQENPHTYITT